MPLESALPMLGMLGVAVAIYAALHRIAARVLASAGVGRLLRESWRPMILSISLFALAILAFGMVAAPLRYDPGSGIYREGADWDAYLVLARSGLLLTYAAAAVVAVAVGAWPARPGFRAVTALITLVGLFGFMILAAPLTEMIAECYANVTLLLRPSC